MQPSMRSKTLFRFGSSLRFLLTHFLTFAQTLTTEQTAENARQYAETNGLSEHAELFARAALVARDPQRFEMVPGIPEDELNALKYERDHKWHGPFMLWYAVSLCAVGAATQGWDQTGSNGANL